MSGLIKLAKTLLYSCLFFSVGLFIAYSAFIDNGFMRHPGAELDIQLPVLIINPIETRVIRGSVFAQ